MKANETKVRKFLSSDNTQFVIPVYQRNYDWSEGQCKQLLNDILEAGTNDEMDAHFIGSIVYVHDGIYLSSEVEERTIIDGQQRLTTLTLIYLALHRLAKELKDEKLVNQINETYLINKFAPEEEKLKLKPTENNDEALKYLLRGDDSEEFSGYSKLVVNFNYFKGRITKQNHQLILKGLAKLMFVEILLDRKNDDPQRIFESLNSTGLELSQADLIRNYLLMGLNRKDQNKIYKNYWEVIEKLAKDETLNVSRVSEYIRDYLTLRNKELTNKGKVYLKFKYEYPPTSIDKLEHSLTEIKRLARHYNKLVNPKNETDEEIKLHLEYINRLDLSVAYPFLMKVYDDYDSSVIDKLTFLKVLDLIQSFVCRRFIIGLQTNPLNRIFMSLYDAVKPENYLYSIQKSLLQKLGVNKFPKNGDVIDALKVKDVYHIKPKNRIYLLERLENFNNNERVEIEGNSKITIEHIFPQNPDQKWKEELSDDEYNFIKGNYLNTIGNLTLSGNNGKLGNKPFIDKRDLKDAGYKDSRLWLNKYLSELEKWDEIEIEKRCELITKRFLQIWEYPEINIESNGDSEELNIFDAEDLADKKLEYALFFDQKIEVTDMAKLYAEVFKRLFEHQSESFFTTDLGEQIGLTNNRKNLNQAVRINDTYFIDAGMDNVSKFDKIKQALTIFDIEDELSIKYADEVPHINTNSPGRRSRYSGKRIYKLVEGNPRRFNSWGWRSFNLVIDGMTYEEYRLKGGRLNDLQWDIDNKYVEVK